MVKVLMLLKSNFFYDTRVLKESRLLLENNYDLLVIFSAKNCTKEETIRQKYIHVKYPLRDNFIFSKILNRLYVVFKIIIIGIKFRPGICHCHDLNTLLEGFIISIFTKAKLIYDAHELWYGRKTGKGFFGLYKKVVFRINKIMEKILCLKVSKIFVVSDLQGKLIKNNLMIYKKIITIRNICDWSKDTNPENLIDNRFKFTKGKTKIICRESIENNGIEVFDLSVLEVLKRIDDVVVILVGNIKRSDKIFFIDIIKKLSLERKFIFIKRTQPDILKKYICSSDIGLIPRKDDCLNVYVSAPNKLFEYISCGIPVISTDLPEIQKIITDSNIGVVYREGDNIELQKSIINIKNKANYREYQNNLNKVFLEKYNWNIEGKKIINEYNKL